MNNTEILSKLYGMKSRCYNKNNSEYKQYGMRGIEVYGEWLSNPKSFVEWAKNNGWFSGCHIHRKDHKKSYTPDNCVLISEEDHYATKRKRAKKLVTIPPIINNNHWGCQRCNHQWYPRNFDDKGNPIPPICCPACKSAYWKVEKKKAGIVAEKITNLIG